MEENDYEFVFKNDKDVFFHLEIIIEVLEGANKSEIKFLADLTLVFMKIMRRLKKYITDQEYENLLKSLSIEDLETINILNNMKRIAFEMENKFDGNRNDSLDS